MSVSCREIEIEPCDICGVEDDEEGAFGTRDGAPAVEPSEYPEQYAHCGEDYEIKQADCAERQRGDCGCAAEDKEDVEDV